MLFKRHAPVRSFLIFFSFFLGTAAVVGACKCVAASSPSSWSSSNRSYWAFWRSIALAALSCARWVGAATGARPLVPDLLGSLSSSCCAKPCVAPDAGKPPCSTQVGVSHAIHEAGVQCLTDSRSTRLGGMPTAQHATFLWRISARSGRRVMHA